MKRARLAYEFKGKKGFFRTRILPKHKRPKGVDGIQLEWANGKEEEKGITHYCAVKDWEALCMIEGLTCALIEKKGQGFKTRSRNRKKKK